MIAYHASDTPAEAYAKGRDVGAWSGPPRPAPRTYAPRQREAWRAGYGRAREDAR